MVRLQFPSSVSVLYILVMVVWNSVIAVATSGYVHISVMTMSVTMQVVFISVLFLY